MLMTDTTINSPDSLHNKLKHKPSVVDEFQPVKISINNSVQPDTPNSTNKVSSIRILDRRHDHSNNEKFNRAKILANLHRNMHIKHIPVVYNKPVLDNPILKSEKEYKANIIDKREPQQSILGKLKRVPVPAPVQQRITPSVQRGSVELGPEVFFKIGDTQLQERMPRKAPPINIKVDSYYMNNREKFIQFINSIFEPYRKELEENQDNITCDTIGKSGNAKLLMHQQIVRDYMNLYTPYRGLLVYHGLGSGKTATSIAIAEGMKSTKKIIILTPASLRTNYIEELKKYGDELYRKNQFWEWISIDTLNKHINTNMSSSPSSHNNEDEYDILDEDNEDVLENESNDRTKHHNKKNIISVLSNVLNLPVEYIVRKKGAWLINVKKPSNFTELNAEDKKSIDEQLNEMIKTKYTFINYNGLRFTKLRELTAEFTKNIFDDAVVIIDEAHNLISRIVNKIKMDPAFIISKDGRKKTHTTSPKFIATRLYEDLMRAKNARIILLSGTPVINYPNEFAILFNILRGYIKTWSMQISVKTNDKINTDSIRKILQSEKTLDYVDYSPSSKILTITRNPFGFRNVYSNENDTKKPHNSAYIGITNEPDITNKTITDSFGDIENNMESSDDIHFERNIMRLLENKNIEVLRRSIHITNYKALPDDFELFTEKYINPNTKELINTNAMKRRILGLSSYFRSAQEKLLPRFTKTMGLDYHLVKIPMSDFQFGVYEKARAGEREIEKQGRKKQNNDNANAQKMNELYEKNTSTYRIFSRLYCNYVMPNRPMPTEEERNERAKKKRDKIELALLEKEREKNKINTVGGADNISTSHKLFDNIDSDEQSYDNIDSDKQSYDNIDSDNDVDSGVDNDVLANSRKTSIDYFLKQKQNQKTISSSSSPLRIIPKKITIKETNATTSKKYTNTDIEPNHEVVKEEEEMKEEEEKDKTEEKQILEQAKDTENDEELEAEKENEVEGDEILEKMGGQLYKEQIENALKYMEQNANEFLSKEALITYSPKFLNILENIQDPEHTGLHLVYSQFRTLEGLGIFSLVLDANGFTRFKLSKNERTGQWKINGDEIRENANALYALYTGTETTEEKEIIRNIYNGDWEYIPTNLAEELRSIAENNNLGKIIKVLMITSSGSEGINLRNTRYVHIMEPYWHPVRVEQVIGRARRICSHKSLPENLQTVEVFIYIMKFSDEQLKSDKSIELRLNDKGPINPAGAPVTSDQYLYEVSELKSIVTGQLTDMIKESAFDCYIYGQSNCMNFTNPGPDDFAYVPDYTKQENDTIAKINLKRIEWKAVKINIGSKEYAGRKIGDDTIELYDLKSYQMGNVVQVGTVKIENGKMILHNIVR